MQARSLRTESAFGTIDNSWHAAHRHGQVDFVSSFKPVPSIERHTKVDSFTLYFAAFFTIDGQPMVEGTKVKFIGGRPVPRCRVSSGIGKSPEAAKSRAQLRGKNDKNFFKLFPCVPQYLEERGGPGIFLLHQAAGAAESCPRRERGPPGSTTHLQ
ncbi:hypothetical protein B0H16DRAFT_1529824 [Mycena metata]|uniref:Uncharacterized protein n=1 Tax=Mycena metata TaxID=1033252 RepID=A0AAD7NIZ8_9AGAR|nr:hypothetical protein B0H16DRAFT_1529824 [Mycena metata]